MHWELANYVTNRIDKSIYMIYNSVKQIVTNTRNNPFVLWESDCKDRKKSRVWQVFLAIFFVLLQLLQLLQLKSQREKQRFASLRGTKQSRDSQLMFCFFWFASLRSQ